MIPLTGQMYRHKKTGGVYVVLFADARIESDWVEAVIYRRVDDELAPPIVRPYVEFADGRFEPYKGDAP